MTDPLSLDRRVQHLEELVTHQQHLLEQLNGVIIDLRNELGSLSRRHQQRFQELEFQIAHRAADDPNEKPPHY